MTKPKMENPFTTVQRWIDTRREQKSQELFEKYMADRRLSPFEAEMVAKVQKDLLSNPEVEVGDETTVTFDDEDFRIIVTQVANGKVTITAEQVVDIQPFKP